MAKYLGDWFDANKLNHMSAYNYFKKHGRWPKGFIPKGMKMGNWIPRVTDKVARAWVEEKLGDGGTECTPGGEAPGVG